MPIRFRTRCHCAKSHTVASSAGVLPEESNREIIARNDYAMLERIGDAYHCERVTKADFEKLAADAGLSRPLMNRRIPELAEAILGKLEGISIESPTGESLAEQIRTRCQHVRELW